MMKTYDYIDKLKPLQSVEDSRRLFDDLFADETPKNKQPDGTYFRSTGVTITDGASSTHRGLEPESNIIEKLIELQSSKPLPNF